MGKVPILFTATAISGWLIGPISRISQALRKTGTTIISHILILGEQPHEPIAEPLAAGDSGLRLAFISEQVVRSARAGTLSHHYAMVIPTLYRTRLSREFSYPVGAEILSEALAGVPNFSDFRICFSDVVSAWKSKFQQMLATGVDYEIIRARLWSPFEIFVYPVQRGLKHPAHEALVSNGLPKMREWMSREGSPSSLKLASGSIVFSPPTLTVRFEERNHVA
jgi:hypothetical protein